MRSDLPLSSVLSATRPLVRIAFAALLALALVGISPADFGSVPGKSAPVGLERAYLGQAVLHQRLSAAFLDRSSAPNNGRASLSDNDPASPSNDVSPLLPPTGGVFAISAVQAPADRGANAYDARAPPIA